jgi:hypothetical protein
MGCREFFQENLENNERCKLLQNVSVEEQLAWETESASLYSPQPITDSEILCRHVLNPVHFDPQTNSIKPNFFEDASGKGASVNRLLYTNIEKIRKDAQARVDISNQNPPKTGLRKLIGYANVTASEVREIYTGMPPRRAMAAYDTAKSDDPSHADICQLVKTKAMEKSVRVQLYWLAKSRFTFF